MIKKYFNFKSFTLLESLLFVDEDLRDIIKILAKGGDKISKSLIMLFDEDIKTNINYLKASDKNDELKFVNDAQVKRFQDAGQNPFDKTVNITKIGRAVRQLFSSNNIAINDQDIENFVNSYKNAWDKKFTKMEGFRLVSGEEIRLWYLEDNYVNGGGQLNSSCMRYERCQPYLDIYVKNPEVCQLLIYVDKSNRLLGRALVWKLTDKTKSSDYFLDRIYTRFDNDYDKISNWFAEHFKTTDYNCFPNDIRGCSVTIKNKDFVNYPYADTFWVLDWDTDKLQTFESKKYDRLQLNLQSTEGGASAPGYKRSKRMLKWIKHENAVFCRYIEDYMLDSDCVKDKYDEYILKEDAIYSKYYEAYILKSDSVETEFGIVLTHDVVKVYDIADGYPTNEKIAIKSSDEFIHNYKSIKYLGKSIFVNNKFLAYSFDINGYVLKTHPGNRLYLYNSSERYIYKSIHRYDCFGVYFQYNNERFFMPYGLSKSNLYYTESSLKIIGVNMIDLEFAICSDELYSIYLGSVKNIMMKFINSLDINDDIKSGKIDEIIKADKYLIERGYETYINLQDFYKNLGNLTTTDYVNDMISDMFKEYKVTEYFDKISEGYSRYIYLNKRSFTGGFIYFNSDKVRIDADFAALTQDEIKKVINDFISSSKYEIYLFAYYFVLFSSRSDANQILRKVLTFQIEKDSSSFRNVIDIVFNEIISHNFYTSISDIAKIMRNEHIIDSEALRNSNGMNLNNKPIPISAKVFIDVFNNFYQKLF